MPQALQFVIVAFQVSFLTGIGAPLVDAPAIDADECAKRAWQGLTGGNWRSPGFRYLSHEWPLPATSVDDLCRRIAGTVLSHPSQTGVSRFVVTNALAEIAKIARLPEAERTAFVEQDHDISHLLDADWRTLVSVAVPDDVSHQFDALQAAGHRLMTAAGNCMRPFVRNGDILWHHPQDRPTPGDLIVLTVAGCPALEFKVYAGFDEALDQAVMFAHAPLCLWGIKLHNVTHAARVTHIWRRGGSVVELSPGHFADKMPDEARQAVARLGLTPHDLTAAESVLHGLAASAYALMVEMTRLPA